MTVGELIEALQALDPCTKVVTTNDWELRTVSGATAYKIEGDFYGKPGEMRLGRGVQLGDNVVEIG